jgi:transcriptional regulator with XRE-family HTH domain
MECVAFTAVNLGQRIASARKAAGLTQSDLATRCGWESASRVGNYEQGIREPSLADLRAMADACGREYAWLVLGEENVKESEPADLDPAALAEAEKWVRFLEAANGGMQPMRRAERLIAIYRMVQAGGGTVAPEDAQAIIKSAQPQGVEANGRTATGD